MLTQSRLQEILHYDPETGDFTWAVRTSTRIRAGDTAGYLRTDGYRVIKVNGRLYRAHRLAWLYVYGVWPADQMDHRNGVCDDNRLCNLREATNAENHQNQAKYDNNRSGFMGVRWHSRALKWASQITFAGRQKHLGLFGTPQAAHAAYLAAKAKFHTFNPTVRGGNAGLVSN